VAISFVTPRQRGFLHAVRKRFGVELTQIPVPSDADVVRQRRGALEARLEEVRDDASLDEDAADAVARLVDSGDWTAEQVAAAAIHLLAEEAGVSLGALPDDEPPAWSVERHRGRDPRERRGPPDRQPTRAGPRGDKPGRPPRGLRGDHSGPVRDEVALFLAAGRRHGVGKGDLVGALANECGIPGERIGRITVLDGRSFVVLQRGDLDKILRERKTLELRGRHAKLDVAR
jgi:ATP-dependent RNA helicase DeaD